MLPYGLKIPNPSPYAPFQTATMTQAAFEFHRAQLYDYSARLHYGLRAGYPGAVPGLSPYHPTAQESLDTPFCTNMIHGLALCTRNRSQVTVILVS